MLCTLTTDAVCGPSGAGKSTLISMLREEFPDDFGFSVSHTTRGPRPGERDGVDYHFSEKAAMEAAIADGKFLESANVHGNLYGTSFEAISSVAEHNRVCVLDIDVQGVESCRRAGFDAAAFIFIAPPSLGSLEARLRKRGAYTEPGPSPSAHHTHITHARQGLRPRSASGSGWTGPFTSSLRRSAWHGTRAS